MHASSLAQQGTRRFRRIARCGSIATLYMLHYFWSSALFGKAKPSTCTLTLRHSKPKWFFWETVHAGMLVIWSPRLNRSWMDAQLITQPDTSISSYNIHNKLYCICCIISKAETAWAEHNNSLSCSQKKTGKMEQKRKICACMCTDILYSVETKGQRLGSKLNCIPGNEHHRSLAHSPPQQIA